MENKITTNTRVRIEKGCAARGVKKNSTAVVKAVIELGADYSHQVLVSLSFSLDDYAKRELSFYARHRNRLSDKIVSLNDGNPLHRIQISRVS